MAAFTLVAPRSPDIAISAPAFSSAVPVRKASVHLLQLSQAVPTEPIKAKGEIITPNPSPNFPNFTAKSMPPLPAVLATVACRALSTMAI